MPGAGNGAQRMAAINPHIEAHMFDLSHFPEFNERYQILSVPYLIINNEKVSVWQKGSGRTARSLEEYLKKNSASYIYLTNMSQYSGGV